MDRNEKAEISTFCIFWTCCGVYAVTILSATLIGIAWILGILQG